MTQTNGRDSQQYLLHFKKKKKLGLLRPLNLERKSRQARYKFMFVRERPQRSSCGKNVCDEITDNVLTCKHDGDGPRLGAARPSANTAAQQ